MIWGRIIFPDALSVDINGMVGQDTYGKASLRQQVDRHYKRLCGSDEHVYCGFRFEPAANHGSGFGVSEYWRHCQRISWTRLEPAGSDGYMEKPERAADNQSCGGLQFTVRMNKDILFDNPYQPERR